MATTDLQTRSRMLSVRLSAEEYDELKQLCFLFGARNLSELARKALHALLGKEDGPSPDRFGMHLSDLSKKVQFLNRKVERLSQILGESSPEEHARTADSPGTAGAGVPSFPNGLRALEENMIGAAVGAPE